MTVQNQLTNNPLKKGRTYAGLSPEERKIQRDEQFLTAGLELFGTIGFRNSTVKSLCKTAKLTDRYFYQSFGSLENLLVATYARCMKNLKRKIFRTIIQTYQNNNAEQAIIAGLDCYFKELENPHIARICLIELEGISPEVNHFYYSTIENFSLMLINLANHAFPNWKLETQQKQIIGVSLIGATRQSATQWFTNQYNTERQLLVDASSQIFLGILNQIKNKEG